MAPPLTQLPKSTLIYVFFSSPTCDHSPCPDFLLLKYISNPLTTYKPSLSSICNSLLFSLFQLVILVSQLRSLIDFPWYAQTLLPSGPLNILSCCLKCSFLSSPHGWCILCFPFLAHVTSSKNISLQTYTCSSLISVIHTTCFLFLHCPSTIHNYPLYFNFTH